MKRLLLPCLLALVLLCGCAAAPQAQTASFFAMDTAMELTVYGGADLPGQVQALISDLEGQLSVTDPNSALYAVNASGSGTLTGRANTLMGQALDLCRRTDGALDLSIYPVVRAWGFTTGDYQVPDDAALADLTALVDYTRIDYDPASGAVALPTGMEIDLGSVAKGCAGREAAQLLRQAGVASALLNLGGNIQTVGSRPDGDPWQIGVKDPATGQPMMVLSIRDQAVVTSGGYERYFQQDGRTYWHIMDPDTGRPAENGLRSVTIVGDDGLVCDGLSTALFVMGLERAARFWAASDDFEAIFVTDDGTVYLTQGLTNRFALTQDYGDTTVRVVQR